MLISDVLHVQYPVACVCVSPAHLTVPAGPVNVNVNISPCQHARTHAEGTHPNPFYQPTVGMDMDTL